jgi:hypothetical protein
MEDMYPTVLKLYRKAQRPVWNQRLTLPATLGNYERFGHQLIVDKHQDRVKDQAFLDWAVATSQKSFGYVPHFLDLLPQVLIAPIIAQTVGFLSGWLLARGGFSYGGFDPKTITSFRAERQIGFRWAGRTLLASVLWSATSVGYDTYMCKHFRDQDIDDIEDRERIFERIVKPITLVTCCTSGPF